MSPCCFARQDTIREQFEIKGCRALPTKRCSKFRRQRAVFWLRSIGISVKCCASRRTPAPTSWSSMPARGRAIKVCYSGRESFWSCWIPSHPSARCGSSSPVVFGSISPRMRNDITGDPNDEFPEVVNTDLRLGSHIIIATAAPFHQSMLRDRRRREPKARARQKRPEHP